MDVIATIPPTERFCSKFFGSIDGLIAFAWIFSIHQNGAASAAYGAGRTRDIFLTYESVFLIGGGSMFYCNIAPTMLPAHASISARFPTLK